MAKQLTSLKLVEVLLCAFLDILLICFFFVFDIFIDLDVYLEEVLYGIGLKLLFRAIFLESYGQQT